ncbi:MAG: BrnT family toxin [Vicinamibacterales bacterium]
MRFSWDARKSSRNLRERGFDFEFATQVFDGSTLERADTRRDYGEHRVIALGTAQGITLTVVYTDRAESMDEVSRRIISARKSNRREREAYQKATSPHS